MKLALIFVFCCSLAGSLMAQAIYRLVDEQGRVTYTDQKPDDGAEPIDLPDLTIIDDPDQAPPLITAETGEDIEPLKLQITDPGHGERIHSPSGELALHLDSSIEIPAAALLVVYINDVAQEPIRQQSIRFAGLAAGSYRLRAELQTPSGRVLAGSDTIEVLLDTGEPGVPR